MWDFVEKYLFEKPNFLLEHHILSYEFFCETELPKVVKQFVKCDTVKVSKDLKMTAEACVEVAADFGAKVFAVNGRSETFLGTLPRLTERGTFIVRGVETVLPVKEEPDSGQRQHLGRVGKYEAKLSLQHVWVGLAADTATELHGEVEVGLPGQRDPVPLFVAMRALGALSDREICEMCAFGDAALQDRLRASVYAAGQIYTISLARTFAKNNGSAEWFETGDPRQKMHQLSFLVRELLRAGATPSEGSQCGKRLRLCGDFLAQQWCESMKAHLAGKPADRDLAAHFDADAVGKGVFEALRRCGVPIDPSANFFEWTQKIRSVSTAGEQHLSHWGVYDVVESVDRQKQLCLLTRVTVGYEEELVLQTLKGAPTVALTDASPAEHGSLVQIVVNGRWVASTSDPGAVMGALKTSRRAAVEIKESKPSRSFAENVNFEWDVLARAIHVRTTAGRVQRPLFYALDDGHMSCDDLPEDWTWASPGGYEYLDYQEATAALIASERKQLTKEHTHLEVHNSLILGAATNMVAALPEHTPAADLRNLARNVPRFFPPAAFCGAELPLLQSGYYAGCGVGPFGANVVAAVCSYGGAGGAIILNQAAVERGLFSAVRHRTYSSVGRPTVRVGDSVAEGSPLADDAVALEGGVVDNIFPVGGATQIKVRSVYAPQPGSVFSARNGAQYVCCRVMAECDLPFSQQGLRPDVIVPVPESASAASLLLEILMGKVHASQGSFADCTAFETPDRLDFYLNECKRRGMKTFGEETLYHGVTGEMISAPIFIGPLYVAPLTATEPEWRAEWARSVVTHQPIRGELFDETSKDACVALGLSATVQDALVARSDGEPACVDQISGLFAVENADLNLKIAPEVDGPIQFDGDCKIRAGGSPYNTFSALRVPRAFRVLTQELAMANVQLRMVTAAPRVRQFDAEDLRGCFRSMVAVTPEHLENEFAASSDQNNCFSPLWQSLYPGKIPTLFPTVSSDDWLKCVLLTSHQITPTADMRAATFNQEKLDGDTYASMDWRRAVHTIKYFYNRLNTGVFVRIVNNRVVNFDPICNPNFSNDFLHRLSLDGEKPATPEALRTVLGSQFPARWAAVGRMLKLNVDPSDGYLAQVYDMLVETCSRRTVHDCFFVVNRTDHPVLGKDGTEAFPAFYGAKKVDPIWKGTFVPVLSQCSSANHADIPIPTGDDWEAITTKYFASMRSGGVRCKNGYPNIVSPNWSDRSAVVEMETFKRIPIFFWSGAPFAHDPKHPRTLLQEASKEYAKKGRKGDILGSGALRVSLAAHSASRAPVEFKESNKLILVHPPEKVRGEAPSLQAQAAKYKFVFHVEGNGAALDLGCLFKYGFCVLHVESEFKVWFEPWVAGGDVEEYDPSWCYLKIRRDLSNLDNTIEWCANHDDECNRIADNGRRFFDTYLTKANVYDYMSTTLNDISSRQRRSEFTAEEEVTHAKDVTTFYGRTHEPGWKAYAGEKSAACPLHTVALVAIYADHQAAEVALFLKHYASRNVLLLKASGAPRGALYNAAFRFLTTHAPDVKYFLFLNLAARFKPEFAKRFFGAGSDKGVIDFGKAVGMPVGWAIRFSADAFTAVNGFPNTVYDDENAETAVLTERLHRAQKKWVPYYPDTSGGILSGSPPKPPAPRNLTTEGKAVVLADRIRNKIDGVNTIQFKVGEHIEGDWTQTPPTTAQNIRTLKIQILPEATILASNGAPAVVVSAPIVEEAILPVKETEMVQVHLDLPLLDSVETLPLLENTETLQEHDAPQTKVIKFDA